MEDSCQAAAEVCDQYLISMRLYSGPLDEDTSWRSGKKIDHFTFLTQNVWYNKIILIPLHQR